MSDYDAEFEKRFDFQKERQRHFGDEAPVAVNARNAQIEDWTPSMRDWRSWVKFELPYYNPNNPIPIPTVEEIEAARGTDDDITQNLPCSASVYRVGAFAVKPSSRPRLLHASISTDHGHRLWLMKKLQEAENLMYLEKHCPDLRVPRVHAVFEHQGGDPLGLMKQSPNRFPDRASLPTYYYAVFELLPGKSCYPEVWDTPSKGAKATVKRKMGEQMRLLRAVPPPEPAYYGRIYHQGWPTIVSPLLHSAPYGTQLGPYDTHEAFVNALQESVIWRRVLQISDRFYESENVP
ncbi:hypothetical protein CC80DRAFT_551118 [Byssothecium circinans]|uniref:Aminoglycoside phosphotransferase domain-containing protein n=1 Tax=Byssothecium circinans TaxID=147558 RepID=A0A6A5TSW4_9PLEO|nr:hypothetical protein CC80DRAFT_551118 [Byssothecium circinans]